MDSASGALRAYSATPDPENQKAHHAFPRGGP
jgi:hypothetical protein